MFIEGQITAVFVCVSSTIKIKDMLAICLKAYAIPEFELAGLCRTLIPQASWSQPPGPPRASRVLLSISAGQPGAQGGRGRGSSRGPGRTPTPRGLHSPGFAHSLLRLLVGVDFCCNRRGSQARKGPALSTPTPTSWSEPWVPREMGMSVPGGE